MVSLDDGLMTPTPAARLTMSERKSATGPGRSLSMRLREPRTNHVKDQSEKEHGIVHIAMIQRSRSDGSYERQ
jgi:hypothetical protein